MNDSFSPQSGLKSGAEPSAAPPPDCGSAWLAWLETVEMVVRENPDPVLRVSRDGTLLYANPTSTPLLDLWGTAAGGKLPAPLWAAISEALGSCESKELEVECGKQTLGLAVVPVGQDGYVNLYGHDITARKRLEAEFLQAQKMEGIGRLASGVAHDFNNLLTAILGNCEFLLGQLQDGDARRAEVLEIQAASERASALTRQLLIISRKHVVQAQVLDLNAVVRNIESMLRRLIGEDVLLSTVLRPGLWSVRADPGLIEQAIMNLVVNARDAMPQGGKITIETADVELAGGRDSAYFDAAPGPYVMLSVSDSGSGMSREVLARLFEPFFTTKEAGKGTGLGLSTVHGIVKAAGGSVSVYSEVGYGSTFKVFLPKAAGSPLPAPSEPVGSLDGSETILLIEDDDRLRRMARRILADHGYSVLEARDGAEGLRVYEEHGGPIHLVFTDVVMPQMSGEELVRKLSCRHAGVKVLYCSGYTKAAVAGRALVATEAPFLQKPFSPAVLLRKVRHVLDGKG